VNNIITIVGCQLARAPRRMSKRKTDRGKVPLSSFQAAAQDVNVQKLSIRESAEKHDIDRMTLTRYLKKINEKGPSQATMGYSSHRKIFSDEMEIDLARHLSDLCNRFFGLTTDKARSLAWEFAVRNDMDIPDAWKRDQQSGKKWLRKFMERQSLTLRIPEATSYGRATAFNKENVSNYFDNLYNVMEKYKFDPAHIYNMDETGCFTVQTPKKVLAQKGTRQVSSYRLVGHA